MKELYDTLKTASQDIYTKKINPALAQATKD